MTYLFGFFSHLCTHDRTTDFFNGGELYSYISRGRFSEERSRFYAAEITLGIEALHTNNVVYRDLKVHLHISYVSHAEILCPV